MKLKLKKGLDLDLAGAVAPGTTPVAVTSPTAAVIPDDYPGLLPKLEVKEGDTVAAGQPLLRDKNAEAIKIVSPVGGTVTQIVRGERRKIMRVVVSVGSQQPYSFDVSKADTAEGALELLCASGMLARMRQRPYDIVPDPAVKPRDIFVNAIDSAPLSAGYGKFDNDVLAKGVALLRMLTPGKVYVSVPADWQGDIAGAEMVTIEGKHPVGNISVQIANIKPVNKGEVVWGLDIVTLNKIGQLLATGTVDCSTTVAITGSEVEMPCLIDTCEGAEIAPLLAGRLKASEHHVRIISGNVLTGTAVEPDGYLHFPYRQITVIPEGDDVAEFMGWASMAPRKMSQSRSFLSKFFGHKFAPDARLLGGRRAMIMSGEYDKYMPMDILPEYLVKAILSKNIEEMERLGIYEVAPEDFALAEYADTSKLPLQQIVRDGLDYLRKELQ